jgi:hypothetical protein
VPGSNRQDGLAQIRCRMIKLAQSPRTEDGDHGLLKQIIWIKIGWSRYRSEPA